MAERLIGHRGRGNYTGAADCLRPVRVLHRELAEEATWQSLIAMVRGENPRLPALQDELNKAGL